MLLLLASLAPFVAVAPVVAIRSWKLSSAVAVAALLLSSILLLMASSTRPVEEYPVEHALDLIVLDGSGFNLTFAILASSICAVQAAVSPYFMERKAGSVDSRIYFSLYLISSGALLMTPLSGSLTTFFLLFETYILSTWLLLILIGGRRAGEAVNRYLLFTEAGALVTLLGLALVYDEFDTFRFDRLSLVALTPREVTFFLALLLAAPLAKMPIFPLHVWLPGVYSVTPPPLIGILMAAEGVAGWAATRLLLLWPQAFSASGLVTSLVTLGIFTAIYSGLSALAQVDYRRLLAYASIGGSGLLLVTAACSGASLAGVVLLSFEHALAKNVLLITLGYIEGELEVRSITKLGGLAASAPRSAVGTFIAALSLAGMPPTLGFWAEVAVLASSASSMSMGSAGTVVMLAIALALTLYAACSIWLFKRVFFGNARMMMKETWCSVTFAAFLLSASLVVLGVYPMVILMLL